MLQGSLTRLEGATPDDQPFETVSQLASPTRLPQDNLSMDRPQSAASLEQRPSLKARLERWLRQQTPLRVFAGLFLIRQFLLLPVLLALHTAEIGPALPPGVVAERLQSPVFLLYILVVAPIGETAMQCSLLHLLMRDAILRQRLRFIVLSALLMVLVHPWGWVSVPPFVTGAVLAACYVLFVERRSAVSAFAMTATLHASFNLLGLPLLVWSAYRTVAS